ncbi:unnamed protein product, partial [Ectocarpus sp. 12 AP-2014]
DDDAEADEWDSAISVHRQALGCDGPVDGGPDGSGGDRGGHFSEPFGIGGGDVMYNRCMALQLASSSFRSGFPSLSALSAAFSPSTPGATFFLGDTGAVIHATPSGNKVFNR